MLTAIRNNRWAPCLGIMLVALLFFMGMQVARPIPLANAPSTQPVLSLTSPVPGTAGVPVATPPMVPQEELVDLLEEESQVNAAEEQLSSDHGMLVFVSHVQLHPVAFGNLGICQYQNRMETPPPRV